MLVLVHEEDRKMVASSDNDVESGSEGEEELVDAETANEGKRPNSGDGAKPLPPQQQPVPASASSSSFLIEDILFQRPRVRECNTIIIWLPKITIPP